jgi:hypothetical protein
VDATEAVFNAAAGIAMDDDRKIPRALWTEKPSVLLSIATSARVATLRATNADTEGYSNRRKNTAACVH